MVENVVQLAAHDNMTVRECLSYVLRNYSDAESILICGYSSDDNFFHFGSSMTRKDVLWLAMALADAARGLDD